MLAKVVRQLEPNWLTHRHREQALLPQGLVPNHKSRSQPKNLWELSLLAKAVCQPTSNWLTHRHREQARSHRDWCPTTNPDPNQKTCRS